MFRNCQLPPLYRLITVDGGADVAAEAGRLAASGAEPATVICAAREDRLDCAVILHPDLPAAEARLAIYLLALGLGDALGAVVPAGIDVTYRWPNVIEANVGAVARVGIDLPEAAVDGEVAGWLVARATVVIGALPGEGLRQGFPETSLHDEGCVDFKLSFNFPRESTASPKFVSLPAKLAPLSIAVVIAPNWNKILSIAPVPSLIFSLSSLTLVKTLFPLIYCFSSSISFLMSSMAV